MKIERFEDILRALRDHPEWLEELRAIVLTEELLAVPSMIAALNQRQDRFEERQDRFDQRMDRFEERMDRFDQRLAVLEGEAVERRYRRNGSGYFGRIARRVRLVTIRERDDLLDDLEEAGTLTSEEADAVRLADGLYTARRDGQPVRLLLEASLTIGRSDVQRAAERAALLARAGMPVLPVVAGGAVPDDIAAEAATAGVWVVTNGTVDSPDH